MDAREFLEAVHGETIDDEHRISIFTLPNRESRFFASCEQAAAYGLTCCESRQNVYVGCCQYGAVTGGGRGVAENVTAVPALWLDVDFGEGHKKQVPPDEAAALSLIERGGVPPSILVHSGHGFHAWWLLDEALPPNIGARIQKLWNTLYIQHATESGWIIDSVFDLARVLRLPGTSNFKGGGVVDCTVLDDNGRHWPLDLFEDRVSALRLPSITDEVPHVDIDALRVDADASPNLDKLDALRENDKKFARTWNGTRSDLPDQSPSSYDLAAASIAARANWSDAEIAALIVARRRRAGHDVIKALRKDYLARTIGRARDQQHTAEEIAARLAAGTETPVIDEDGQVLAVANNNGNDTEQRRLLRRVFGRGDVRWLQFGTEDAEYELRLGIDHRIFIDSSEVLLSQGRFMARYYDATQMVLQRQKQYVWDRVAAALGSIVEKHEAASRADRVEQWLASYLGDRPPTPYDQRAIAVMRDDPFLDQDGRVNITSHSLARYVAFTMQEAMTNRKVSSALRAAGWSSVQANCEDDNGRRINRRYWVHSQH